MHTPHYKICDTLVSMGAFNLECFCSSRRSPLRSHLVIFTYQPHHHPRFTPIHTFYVESLVVVTQDPHSGSASCCCLFHARMFPSTGSCVDWIDPTPVQVKCRFLGILRYFLWPELQSNVVNLSDQASHCILALSQFSSLFVGRTRYGSYSQSMYFTATTRLSIEDSASSIYMQGSLLASVGAN